MPKFYNHIDLNKNQLKNAAVHNVPDTPNIPSNAAVGQIYFDTNNSSASKNRLFIRNIAQEKWLSIPYGQSSAGDEGSIVNLDIATNAGITVGKLLTTGTGAVTLSSIGVPSGEVAFNSQNITGVGALTTSGNVTVGGDLTVNGNTTTINTTDLNVEDKNVIIANVTNPDNDTADGAGITIKGLSDKTFTWVKATTAFTSSENFNLVSGKTYQINGTTVLSSSAVLGRTPGGAASGDLVTINDTQALTGKTYNGLTVSTTTGTLTIASGSTLATSGANSITLASTGTTSVTLPTSGTLATVPTGSNQSTAVKYTTTFTASSGNVVATINQTTHNLSANRNLIVQVSEQSTGAVVYADVVISSGGNVTITFADVSSSYGTYDITIIG